VTTELLRLRIDDDERFVPCAGLASLAEVLREQVQVTSVKVGCAEGYCGSCTVIVDDQPVLACLTPAITCEGKSVRTLDSPGELAGLQEALQQQLCERDAVQCGMCTPGIVALISSLIGQGEIESEEDIAPALAGSICRCSGYARIVDAVQHVLTSSLGKQKDSA